MFSFKNCSIGRRVNGAIVITLFLAMAALAFAAHSLWQVTGRFTTFLDRDLALSSSLSVR